MWWSKDSFRELVLSFYLVGSRNLTQDTGLDSRCLSFLSHLHGPQSMFDLCIFFPFCFACFAKLESHCVAQTGLKLLSFSDLKVSDLSDSLHSPISNSWKYRYALPVTLLRGNPSWKYLHRHTKGWASLAPALSQPSQTTTKNRHHTRVVHYSPPNLFCC